MERPLAVRQRIGELAGVKDAGSSVFGNAEQPDSRILPGFAAESVHHAMRHHSRTVARALCRRAQRSSRAPRCAARQDTWSTMHWKLRRSISQNAYAL